MSLVLTVSQALCGRTLAPRKHWAGCIVTADRRDDCDTEFEYAFAVRVRPFLQGSIQYADYWQTIYIDKEID